MWKLPVQSCYRYRAGTFPATNYTFPLQTGPLIGVLQAPRLAHLYTFSVTFTCDFHDPTKSVLDHSEL